MCGCVVVIAVVVLVVVVVVVVVPCRVSSVVLVIVPAANPMFILAGHFVKRPRCNCYYVEHK